MSRISDENDPSWYVEYNSSSFYKKKGVCEIYGGFFQEIGKEDTHKHPVAVKICNGHQGINDEVDKRLLSLNAQETRFITKLYKVLKTNLNYYQIFEYCDSKDLHRLFQKIEHKKTLIGTRAKFVFAYQLVLALQTLEQKGIIHNDLSLKNILFHSKTVQGTFGELSLYFLKITDFGQSQIKSIPSKKTKIRLTINYSSPEKLNIKGYEDDTTSDIYSLGIILYQLFYEIHPFSQGLKFRKEPGHEAYYRNYINQCREPESNQYDNRGVELSEDQEYFIKRVIIQMLSYNKMDRPSLEEIVERIRSAFEDIDKWIFKVGMAEIKKGEKEGGKEEIVEYFYVKGLDSSPVTGQFEVYFQSFGSSQFKSISKDEDLLLLTFLQNSILRLKKSQFFKQPQLTHLFQSTQKIVGQFKEMLESICYEETKAQKLMKQLSAVSSKILYQLPKTEIKQEDVDTLEILVNLYQIQKTKGVFDKNQKLGQMPRDTLFEILGKMDLKFKIQQTIT